MCISWANLYEDFRVTQEMIPGQRKARCTLSPLQMQSWKSHSSLFSPPAGLTTDSAAQLEKKQFKTTGKDIFRGKPVRGENLRHAPFAYRFAPYFTHERNTALELCITPLTSDLPKCISFSTMQFKSSNLIKKKIQKLCSCVWDARGLNI